MEYTVQALSRMAGVSARTLRYYDGMGILKPARINSSGYRIYGEKEADRLQQILFYRELGVSLEEIRAILESPSFDEIKALKQHRARLLDRKEQLDLLIANVEKSIEMKERNIKMSDKEKFEGFKKKLIDDNEKKFGSEVRGKYGNDAVDKSNKKIMGMTQDQYNEAEKLSKEVIDTLNEAFKTGDPAGELAQKTAELHKKWLMLYWDRYTKEAHAGLARMYVEDERFKAFYDKDQPGAAEFLRDAILIYTGEN